VYEELRGDMQALRRRAEALGPLQRRIYTIDISRDEFCEGKVQRQFDDYIVYVYSLEMIAAEKLRAICQQMPGYSFGLTCSPSFTRRLIESVPLLLSWLMVRRGGARSPRSSAASRPVALGVCA